MKEEIDFGKELIESRKFTRKWCKGFHARNSSWIYVFKMEKDQRFR